MFKHAAKREVDWPVEVSVAQDGGTVQTVEVTLRYRLATSSEIRSMSSSGIGMLDGEEDLRALEKVCGHITGWDKIVDEDDNPIEFTQENLYAVMENPAFARAATIGLVQASSGAAAKNS